MSHYDIHIEYDRLKRVENLIRICTTITEKIKEYEDIPTKEIRIPCDDVVVIIGGEMLEYLKKNGVDITYYGGREKSGIEIKFK